MLVPIYHHWRRGRTLNGKIVKLWLENEVLVGTALLDMLDMYSKSGDIESSKRIFFRMPAQNEVSGTAMIQGLADCEFAEESLKLLEEMKKRNIIPTATIFLSVSVLFASSHCRLVDRGFHYSELMEKEYGILPNERHYNCMVDLLS